jgi:toxin CcdB
MVACAVFTNAHARTRETIPYLVDVQSELLSGLGTRVVVPLYRQGVGVQAITRLTPVLSFQGQTLVAMVPEMAGIPCRELGPQVGDLAAARGELLAALDLLLTGF